MARVMTALAAVDAATWLGSLAFPALDAPGAVLSIALWIALIAWMFRARVNAARSGWFQRYSRWWAIGAWFVPFGNFYIPFWIMEDVWRAGGAPRWERGRAVLPRAWWASMLALSYFLSGATPARIGPFPLQAGLSLPGKVDIIVAVAMTTVITAMVSRTWLGNPRPQDGV